MVVNEIPGRRSCGFHPALRGFLHSSECPHRRQRRNAGHPGGTFLEPPRPFRTLPRRSPWGSRSSEPHRITPLLR
ncbi:MAG: hypothetical protein MZV64_37100 [Ignavibacteriales bacterium]|nr:hypothetical protein [Ignavibacteriales bacterium]